MTAKEETGAVAKDCKVTFKLIIGLCIAAKCLA